MRLSMPIATVLLLASPAPGGEAPLFPFVLPHDAGGASVADVSGLLEAPAGKHGPVAIRDGHLHAGPSRLRLLGVNLCFGANFPTHDAAAKVAARLARFGVNCVRFHHMDMFSAPDGIFAKDGRKLDPDRLDRLDYLIAELKKRGIYADLNLHVSRSYPGMPKWEGMPGFHKGVDNFHPRMIEFQREYARGLLTHRNPYTNSRYADEPAVAIVEINNENALWQDWFGGRLDAMPRDYADELAKRWNAWLATKYKTDAALRRGWSGGERPLGPAMLRNGKFAKGLESWTLERHEGTPAEVAVGRDGPGNAPSARVTIPARGREGWHVQLVQSGLSFASDRSYTLGFWARSDKPRKVAANVSQAHPPWGVLWSSEVEVTPEWRPVILTFRPSRADDNARLVFSGLAAESGTADLADVSLSPSRVVGVDKGESLGTMKPFPKKTYAHRTEEARRDWARFLLDVETDYWTGMAKFLKADLGVKCPVVGTQMGWSPFPVQEKLDAIDSHAYWHHPRFPKGDWDPVNWTIKNEPMTGSPDGGTLPGLALSRVEGKPFLCTEYNHSAPSTYSSEAFPLLSGFAGAQGWDGIFAFAYSHRRDAWGLDHFGSFFDIDAHPAKMVTLPAAFAAFVRGDVPEFSASKVARPTAEAVLQATTKGGPYVSAAQFGVSKGDALSRRVAVAIGDGENVEGGGSGRAPFSWRHERDGRGVAIVDSPRSASVVGSTTLGPFSVGGVAIAPGPNRQGWAAFTLTAIDGRDLGSPGRILVTATGYVENAGMGWKDAEKTTVGRDWGAGPTLVEGIPATITLPVPAPKVRAWPLDERGRRRSEMPASDAGGKAALAIGPQYQTLWYEVEISP